MVEYLQHYTDILKFQHLRNSSRSPHMVTVQCASWQVTDTPNFNFMAESTITYRVNWRYNLSPCN